MLNKLLDMLVPVTLVIVFFWLLGQEPVVTMSWQNVLILAFGYWVAVGMAYLVPKAVYEIFVPAKK